MQQQTKSETRPQQPNEITAREAARLLGCHLSYFYTLLYTGKIQGRKIDGTWLVPKSAIEARLRKQRG